jgi:hypothetical protein
METERTTADRYYDQHKANVRKYQKEHKEEMREKCKNYQKRLKEERPEDYQAYLQRKRDYYIQVLKPKRQAKKQQQQTQLDTTTERD